MRQAFFDSTLPDSKNLPGIFQLYSKEIDGNQVLIGWRDSENANSPVAEVSRLSVGVVVGACGWQILRRRISVCAF